MFHPGRRVGKALIATNCLCICDAQNFLTQVAREFSAFCRAPGVAEPTPEVHRRIQCKKRLQLR